ncbi:MAG: methyltransferase domain-containing protein [Pseudomonadota bacterium]
MVDPSLRRLFDRNLVAQNRDRAAARFDEYAFLLVRESTQLLERLDDVSRDFEYGLDVGSHNGLAAQALLEHGKVRTAIALERSPGLAKRSQALGIPTIVADEDMLPIKPASFDLAVSLLSLHWTNDLAGAMIQIRHALKPDGLFLGCLFGGGTLKELRTSLIAAETEILGGASPRLSPLPGLQDMAALMQRSGFALPVVDIEHVTVRYSHPLKLIEDLRGMGEQAAFTPQGDGGRRPLSRRLLNTLAEAYFEQFSEPDGKVCASFEIIWVSGWAPAASQPKPLKPGSGRASLADAVKQAGQKKSD